MPRRTRRSALRRCGAALLPWSSTAAPYPGGRRMKGLHILVIGGGIAGLALGRLLGRRHNVRIVEKSESLHTSGTGLMLGINAMQVLQRMNLAGEVKSKGRELDRFVISDHRDRPLSTLQFSKQVRARGLGLYSIHRSRLSEILFQGLAPHTISTPAC